jgi:hypothetical protein
LSEHDGKRMPERVVVEDVAPDAGGPSRVQLDGAAEAGAERLLERDIEEAGLLELLCATERADVDGPQPAVGGEL